MARSKYKKRADGRYLAQIPTGDYDDAGRAKLKNIYARTQTDLDAKVAEFRRQLEVGSVIVDEDATVEKWAEQWQSAYKSALEDSTRNMYASALRKHIVPALGRMKLCNVRQHHIQEFINKKATEKRKGSDAPYSKRMLEIILLTVRQLFEQAEDNHMIKSNPAKKVKLPPKVLPPKEEKRALTSLEEKLFLKLVDQHPNGVFFKTLYYTGMRPEEARALTVQDLDFANDTIRIDGAVSLTSSKPVIKGCKTESSYRTIPMPAQLKSALQSLMPFNGLIVFPAHKGGLMNKKYYDAICNDFDSELNSLAGGTKDIRGVDRFTPYILRHNFATKLVEAGFSPHYIMSVMGHSSIDVTLKYYVHVSDKLKASSDLRLKTWDMSADTEFEDSNEPAVF